MPRQRMLSPGFFTDAALLSLSPLHRLLFAGLWCWADREGRLEDRPVDLKIRILPMDNCDVGAMLDELAAAGLVVRYTTNGLRCLKVRNFLKHQKPHFRETASKLPDPPAAQGSLGLQSPRSPGSAQGSRGLEGGGSRAESESESESESDPTTCGHPPAEIEAAFKAVPIERRDPNLRTFSDALCSEFSRRRDGARYEWQGAKDTEALKRIQKHGLPEVIRRWRNGLTADFGRIHTVAQLAMKWNDFAAVQAKRGYPGSEPEPPPLPRITDEVAATLYQPGGLYGGKKRND